MHNTLHLESVELQQQKTMLGFSPVSKEWKSQVEDWKNMLWSDDSGFVLRQQMLLGSEFGL